MLIKRLSLVGLSLLAAATFAPVQAQQPKVQLTVYAASSLTDAFGEIKSEFEAANPNIEILYSFAASSALTTQIIEGAPAAVFASANKTQVDKVAKDSERISGDITEFVRNELVLIIPVENTANITTLADLSKTGVKLVVAAPNVPIRQYTDEMLDKLAADPQYGESYKTAFLANIVSEEDNVRQVSAKVSLGEADAGIVYLSDVTRDIADKVTVIRIESEYNVVASYYIAPIDVGIAETRDEAVTDAAESFIAFVIDVEGQTILESYNFIPVIELATSTAEGTMSATTSATTQPTAAATQAATAAR